MSCILIEIKSTRKMLPNVENSLCGISCYVWCRVWWLDQDYYFAKHPTHDFSKDYYKIAQKSPQKQQMVFCYQSCSDLLWKKMF